MPSTDSTVRIKADISKLRSEMQAAARQVRLVNSEFKAATAGMDDWTKSEEGLTAKIKQLNGTLDAQKKKLDLLNDEYKQTVALYGENSAAADKVRISINNQEAAIAKTEKELQQYNNQLEELPKTLDETSDAAEKAADGFTVIKGALADLVADGVRATISALKDLAKEAIQVGMDFESSMSKVGAVSGASAEEMQALSDKAKQMGESTIFSASQSAEAFNYMAMAGWKTEEMLDGIEGVMNLAAASGADLATTSDIVTDALTAMGYGAKYAGRLADVMAAASSNANTNVEMMGSTFQYAAPIIGTLGMSMEDAAVAIGLMANAGIKGDKAGTALRSTLNRLSAPPKQCAEEMEKLGLSLTDSDGKMKSLNQVMLELRGAFSNLSETEATAAAKHIAGAEAMSGLLAIVNASDQDFQKLTLAVNNSAGAAEEMANTMNDNVGGQLTLLKSKIEGIMIKLFERASNSMKRGIETVGQALDKVDWDKVGDKIGDFATKAANFFSYLINNSSRIISVLKTIGTAFAVIFVSQKITTTAGAISTLISAMTSAGTASKALSAAMGALGISMSALPVMAVVGAFAALNAYISKESAEIEEQSRATYGLTQAEQSLIDSIHGTSQAMQEASQARKEEGEAIDSNFRSLENMKNSYNDLIDENGNVKKGSEELAQTLLGNLAEGLGTTVDKLKENIDLNGKLSASIDELIEKKKQEAKIAAYEDDYNQALKDEYDTWKQLRTAKEDQKSAQQTLNEKQEAYNKLMDDMKKADAWGAIGASFKIREASEDLKNAQEKYDSLTQAVEESQSAWSTAQSTIENYEKATSAAAENNSEEVTNSLNKLQGNIVNFGTASKQVLEQQVIDTKRSLDEAKQAYNEGVVDEKFVDQQKTYLDAAINELNNYSEKTYTFGRAAADNLDKGVGNGLSELQGTVGKMAGNAYNALETNLGDWGQLAQYKGGDFVNYLKETEKPAEDEGAAIGDKTVDGAKSTISKMEEPAKEGGETYIKGVESSAPLFENGGRFIVQKTADAATDSAKLAEAPAEKFDTTYSGSIEANAGNAESAAKILADKAVAGAETGKAGAETSGENFALGFINKIGDYFQSAYEKAKEFVSHAVQGAKDGQGEKSPSKVTAESGKNFVLGYTNAITKYTNKAVAAAAKMTLEAVKAVRKAQQEGSPSKLTYESGRNFTQGLINGIASLEGKLIETTKGLVNKTLAELLALENFNFSDATSNASAVFSEGFQKQLDYMTKRIQYANQQSLKDFDNTISNLEAQSAADIANLEAKSAKTQAMLQAAIEENSKKTQNKKVKAYGEALKEQLEYEKNALRSATEQVSENYKKLINTQNEMKAAYSTASSTMISDFTDAMQQYQSAAQKLIDTTMKNVSDDYQKQYDALISKQDNLINKLKNAQDLFNISNANVMRLNDVKAQTESIKRYAEKLRQIKEKVSGDLFDQIASYDMDAGEAFVDRLLSMTDAELKAYADAYDEKMSVSESLTKDLYKTDFADIASGYASSMQKAFQGLPAQLEELGWQSMKGFLNGLTTNTDYMEESVRTFIAGMVDEFKKELGIHSPSKLTYSLGELTGEGFADGLMDMVRSVKKAAAEITDTVKESLDLGDIGTAKDIIGAATGRTSAASGSYVGDRTQIINFNQVNNSPKALDRLTIYRQTNNILFSAKVGLANV